MLNSILALFIISCATLQHSLTFPEPQFLCGLTLWKLEQRSQHPSVAHWEATICWVLCWTQKKPTVVEAEEVDGDRQPKNRCRCGRNFKVVIPLSSRWYTDYLFQLQIPGWSISGEAWDSSLFALCATGVLPEPHLLLFCAVKMRLMWLCTHTEAGGWPQTSFSVTAPPCALKQVLSLHLDLINSAVLVCDKAQVSSCVCFPHAGVSGTCDSAWHSNSDTVEWIQIFIIHLSNLLN